ncbi:MAG: hypothetical protein P8Y64_02555 [Gammaproteobacteria bacterium]
MSRARLRAAADLGAAFRVLEIETDLAAKARPGHVLQLDGKPWPIMRSDAAQDRIDLLGTQTNHSWRPETSRPAELANTPLTLQDGIPLVITRDLGLAPAIFLAQREHTRCRQGLFLIQTADALPFSPQPSRILIPGLPHGTIAASPLLEDWGIPSRICSRVERPGCFGGAAIDLARLWLDSLPESRRRAVHILALAVPIEPIAALASDFGLDCQAWSI